MIEELAMYNVASSDSFPLCGRYFHNIISSTGIMLHMYASFIIPYV